MDDLWKLIAECGVESHPDFIEKIASDIGAMDEVKALENYKPTFGSATDRSRAKRLIQTCTEMHGWTTYELAGALRGASRIASYLEEREQAEMVWTGPQTEFVQSRHSFQVLLEVIKSAKSKLFITSFVAYKIDKVVNALIDAADRGVKVGLLLELSTEEGGKVDTDSIDLFRKNVPSSEIYAWRPGSSSDNAWSGTVHAKCAVADGKTAFITSAN